MSSSSVLERTTFETSRLLEFFTEKELQMQIGASRNDWPLALTKELIDNALDACEVAGVAPDITVEATDSAVAVQDNGPGLPIQTLSCSLDYLVRVSDKAHYVSPTRGQLGNALKCIWAAPFVADGEQGRVEVTTGGAVHVIDVTLDRIAQKPRLEHRVREDGVVKNGTLVKMYWPEIASSEDGTIPSTFYNEEPALAAQLSGLLSMYALFNPHAGFRLVSEDGVLQFERTRSDPKKWLPNRPTSPWWYDAERLSTLIAAYLAEDRRLGRVRTVREVVAEFAGLKGTAKQKAVVAAANLSGKTLEDLVEGGDLSPRPVQALLTAMQDASRMVKPRELGVLGQDHLTLQLVQSGVVPDTVKYKKVEGTAGHLPYVLEVACGWFEESEMQRQIACGLNGSPSLRIPFVRLDDCLGRARVDTFDPVVVVAHLACPRFDFVDRGKSRLRLPPQPESALAEAVTLVTKKWTTLKRQADREHRLHARQIEDAVKRSRRQRLNVKEAAWQVMRRAYLQASSGGRLPANARQVMYQARPLIIELTGKARPWARSSYFTQQLLPDFVAAHPELTAGWNVVFDGRGHFVEPHTECQFELGTLAVRAYIESWLPTLSSDVSEDNIILPHKIETRGPAYRFEYALFIEKEGFYPLLEEARIAERYDLPIFSTKGMSNTAARELVEALTEQDVTILVARDFDKSGFSIMHTLRSDNRRWTYTATPNVVDLGLRLADAEAMGLASEPVTYDSNVDPRQSLRESGATPEECNFLVSGRARSGWQGDRVELNAMTSEQFLFWLESKLQAGGVQKIVPDKEALAEAYRYQVAIEHLQAAINDAYQTMPDPTTIRIPRGLEKKVREAIEGTETPWDEALWEIVCERARKGKGK